MADRKRVSYIFSESARFDLRWLAGVNKRSMTKELEHLIQQAADEERQERSEWGMGWPTTPEEAREIEKLKREMEEISAWDKSPAKWVSMHADMAKERAAKDMAKERAATAPSTPPAAQPQPPTLKDGHNYDSLSYSAKHRASQARAARDAARAVKVKAAKEREDAYANAPKDWTSDPS